VGAEQRIRRADEDGWILSDRPGTGAQFAHEGGVQAREALLFRVGEIDVAEQPPEADGGVADEGLLDPADPPHRPRREAAGQPVGEEEVQILLGADAAQRRTKRHHTVNRSR